MTYPAIVIPDHLELALVRSNSGLMGRTRQIIDLNGGHKQSHFQMRGAGGISKVNDLGLMSIIGNNKSLLLRGESTGQDNSEDGMAHKINSAGLTSVAANEMGEGAGKTRPEFMPEAIAETIDQTTAETTASSRLDTMLIRQMGSNIVAIAPMLHDIKTIIALEQSISFEQIQCAPEIEIALNHVVEIIALMAVTPLPSALESHQSTIKTSIQNLIEAVDAIPIPDDNALAQIAPLVEQIKIIIDPIIEDMGMKEVFPVLQVDPIVQSTMEVSEQQELEVKESPSVIELDAIDVNTMNEGDLNEQTLVQGREIIPDEAQLGENKSVLDHKKANESLPLNDADKNLSIIISEVTTIEPLDQNITQPVERTLDIVELIKDHKAVFNILNEHNGFVKNDPINNSASPAEPVVMPTPITPINLSAEVWKNEINMPIATPVHNNRVSSESFVTSINRADIVAPVMVASIGLMPISPAMMQITLANNEAQMTVPKDREEQVVSPARSEAYKLKNMMGVNVQEIERSHAVKNIQDPIAKKSFLTTNASVQKTDDGVKPKAIVIKNIVNTPSVKWVKAALRVPESTQIHRGRVVPITVPLKASERIQFQVQKLRLLPSISSVKIGKQVSAQILPTRVETKKIPTVPTKPAHMEFNNGVGKVFVAHPSKALPILSPSRTLPSSLPVVSPSRVFSAPVSPIVVPPRPVPTLVQTPSKSEMKIKADLPEDKTIKLGGRKIPESPPPAPSGGCPHGGGPCRCSAEFNRAADGNKKDNEHSVFHLPENISDDAEAIKEKIETAEKIILPPSKAVNDEVQKDAEQPRPAKAKMASLRKPTGPS